MDSNTEISNNDYSTAKPLLISTIRGDIDVNKEPVILKRCQICACDPQVALENCFRITKKEKFSPYLTVENVGFGDAAIVKTLQRRHNLTFELEENACFRISGSASIETEIFQYNSKIPFQEIKSILRIGIVAYEDCKVYLSFRSGDSCELKSGECIIPGLRYSEDRAILTCMSNDWYGPECDDWT